MANPKVRICVNKPEVFFDVELFEDVAPVTVSNFLTYVKEGFYNETIFHRVIRGFMCQGGGFTADMKQKQAHAPIPFENVALPNVRGSIAMARTQDPNSATSQFFVNTVDNSFLDIVNGRPGYQVFGRVVYGMEVIDQISSLPTGRSGFHDDVPKEAVVIKSVILL
jgi:cyclophilin family peptidyl-prolyl cis-trans isomerase